ncbi:MAG: glycosyltransferase family 1 protein [Candidatus Moranbacteria bacterium]|nr:glycosyltransferase family 1 protein [Candidatus Moranbacteria bacterium]
MKIGVDARCLQEGKNTGVEEYTRGLIKYLADHCKDDQIILFTNSFKPIKENFRWLEGIGNVEVKRFKLPNKILNFCFWFLAWPKADKMLGGTDIFFVPNFCFIRLSNQCKKYLTVHDLSFERLPETFSFKRRLWHFFVNPRRLCRDSDVILAVSRSTAADLKDLYKINPSRIRVVYPFFKEKIFSGEIRNREEMKAVKRKYALPKSYFLFLGTIEPRKNISALIEAFEHWKDRYKQNDVKLVIAGQRGWLWKDILERVRNSKYRREIIFTDFIEENDKPYIYAGALLFIYPSLFEGFGFPPLEAMACKVPVITSHCSSLPEIAGDAAVLINPYRSYEIFLGMELLLKDKKVYEKYKKRGTERAKQISKKSRKIEINK